VNARKGTFLMTDIIAILMPGDMGHATGGVLAHHGFDVITCLDGRSDHTKGLAADAGFRDVGSLDAVVTEASMVLSILPPAAALGQGSDVAAAMGRTGAKPVYVDCNAISPMTTKDIAAVIEAAAAPYIDCGIIGLAPGKGPANNPGPRFYVSGNDTAPMEALDGKGFQVKAIGSDVGRASGLKMCYAGLTKGTWSLHTAVLLAAEAEGLSAELREEFAYSQGQTLDQMESRIPRIPADSGRWVGEMEEIAKTFADAGVPSGFHEGAAEIFRLLEKTPFASETRATLDTSRTLDETIKETARHLPKP